MWGMTMKRYILIVLAGMLCISGLNATATSSDKQQPANHSNANVYRNFSNYVPSKEVIQGLIACGALGLISGTAWSWYGDCIDDVSPSTQYVIGNLMIEVPLKFLLQRLAVNPKSRLNSAAYTASSYLSYYMGRL